MSNGTQYVDLPAVRYALMCIAKRGWPAVAVTTAKPRPVYVRRTPTSDFYTLNPYRFGNPVTFPGAQLSMLSLSHMEIGDPQIMYGRCLPSSAV
jgi:hypothetical protein